MIQRTIATLILILLTLTLTGATPALSSDYAVVDDNPVLVRGYYQTVQAAIDSGATWIDVRKGEYAGFTLNRPNVTIVMQGARFYNTTVTVWIETAAEGSVIQGDWEIYGDNTGVALGDFYNGTGVHNAAAYVTLEGLKCTNLLSFCVLNPTAAAHHTVIRDCHIENVAISPSPQLLTGTAILFINGSSQNVVRNCYISGQSQAIGTWYGASHNHVHNNRLINNYGWIGVDSPRSAIEDYGVPGAVNTGNQFYNNFVDGSNASAFELADELRDVVVKDNTVYNVVAAFWMGGSGNNKSLDATIEDNIFYGHAGVVSNWFSGTGDILNNEFHDWEETATTSTIYVPSDALGDVDIVGNEFESGNGVLRYSAITGTLTFKDNRVTTDSASWILYFADTTNGGHVIADNLIDAPNTLAITANNDTQLTIEDNTIYGAVWETGSGSVIADNDIYCSDGMWTGLLLNRVGQVARDNRLYCNNTPVVVQSPSGAMVIDNLVARQDGTATALPTCTGTNVCRDNWTP